MKKFSALRYIGIEIVIVMNCGVDPATSGVNEIPKLKTGSTYLRWECNGRKGDDKPVLVSTAPLPEEPF